MAPQIYQRSARLQEDLLREAGPGDLILVPHRRLARQLWQKQRLRNLEKGVPVWEPLRILTLPDWWRELYQELWAPRAPAPSLVRLALWRRAMAEGPPLEGTEPSLEWAQALDEAYTLLCRHNLPVEKEGSEGSPLCDWRREITRIFRQMLKEQGWLTPADIPPVLLPALEEGALPLPSRVWVVGLAMPAPVEEDWLTALAAHIPVIHLLIRGNPEALTRGVEFPDREEEMAWVLEELLLEHQRGKLPLHRLAVTSPVLEQYRPRLQQLLLELLGPAVQEGGGVYNFSLGDSLAESPLWQAALLPLALVAQGERREELVALFLSPYYQALKTHQNLLADLDRRLREAGVARGWTASRKILEDYADEHEGLKNLAAILDKIFAEAPSGEASATEWVAWLRRVWRFLEFPGDLEEEEQGAWSRGQEVLRDFSLAFGAEGFAAGECLRWLQHAAAQETLPGPGLEEAGLQILGWLELRGLDFDRVFCLGMNSAAFPGSPRVLPLLAPEEKARILGGTPESQDRFAQEIFRTLLGTAPAIVFTRPALENQEPQIPTPFYPGEWEKQRRRILTHPGPVWLASPAVQAALAWPEGKGPPQPLAGKAKVEVPSELQVTQLGRALGCRLRFLLEDLLGITGLAEIESGLSPLERGDRLHKILADFARRCKSVLPPEEKAVQLLTQVAQEVLGESLTDLHWQAEWHRWLGEGDAPGLLREWLALERERQAQGWRWLEVEVPFEGLGRPGWPFTLRGRLDRVDLHEATKEVMIWDYKTGKVPKAAQIFDQVEEFQLPAYWLAVREGYARLEAKGRKMVAAGFIRLRKTRQGKIAHLDFADHRDRWPEAVRAWEAKVEELLSHLREGFFAPEPSPAPQSRNKGACEYCPFPPLCGYPETAGEGGEEA